MPAPLAVDREAVRVLAVAVGVREAARQTNIPESTVKSWSTRDEWLKPVTLPPTMTPQQSASGASKSPAVALQEVMADRFSRSKLAQSKYVADTSEDIANRPSEERIALAGQMLSVAKTGQVVWPEQDSSRSGPVLVNLDLRGLTLPEKVIPVVEVVAEQPNE